MVKGVRVILRAWFMKKVLLLFGKVCLQNRRSLLLLARCMIGISLQSDKYVAIREMLEFIDENNIFSYAKFLSYCAANREDWFRSLCDSSTYVIKEYLKSRKWDYDEEQRRTSEIR